MSRSIKVISILIVLTLALIAMLHVFSAPIKIGFVADLSSRKSNLGYSARNGAIMAVQELNRKGGINGRKIQLLVRDGESDNKISHNQTKNLIENGVKVIIGPVHSVMANPVIKAAEKSGVLVISPTVSTDELSGIDDNFLRVVTNSSVQGVDLAKVVKYKGDKQVLLVKDLDNRSYTESVAQSFRDKSVELGIEILGKIDFVGGTELKQLVQKMQQYEPDAIVFITNGKDAAKIIQLYNKTGGLPNLYGDLWAKWTNIKEFGGKTVNGMILVDAIASDNKSEKELQFSSSYKELFDSDYTIPAVYAYEAVKLYAQAVENGSSFENEDVKRELLHIDPIEGVADNYRLDKYGDVIRKLSYFQIKDNKYQRLQISEAPSGKLNSGTE